MNATMDPDLLKLVQQHVHDLMTDVEKLTFEVQEDRERFSLALAEVLSNLEEMETRLDRMQVEQEAIKRDLSQKIECVETRVSRLENQGEESQNKLKCYSSDYERAYTADEHGLVLSIRKKNFAKFSMKYEHRDVVGALLYPFVSAPTVISSSRRSIHALESNCQVIF